MRHPSAAARWSSRKSVTTAVALAVLTTTGVAASGATPAIGQQAVKPTLSYSCPFPFGSVGSQPVQVRVSATFPATATTAAPVTPTGAGLSVTVPRQVTAHFAALHAATASVSAALDVQVTESGTTADAPWQNFSSPHTPLPAGGSTVMTATGTAPPVTVGTAGTATFRAAGLTLLFSTYRAGDAPTDPPHVLVDCTLKPHQDATLATVPVTTATSGSHPGGIKVGSRTGASAPVSKPKPYRCPGIPKNNFKLNPTLPPHPKPPPGAQEGTGVQTLCTYVAGFSDVRKLHEAAIVGPGYSGISLNIKRFIINCGKNTCGRQHNYFQTDSAGELEYHGKPQLPPATNTLLAFGFMPVTATLQLTELGTLNAYSVGAATPGECPPKSKTCAITTTNLYSAVRLRIYNVKINGVPFNVGPGCQTATPFLIKLTGSTPYYLVQIGGVLTGTVSIPPFTGCGVGENLDSIFTATVSGPDNGILMSQGFPCYEDATTHICPNLPCKPKLERKLTPPPLCTPKASADQPQVSPAGGRQGASSGDTPRPGRQ